MENCANNLLVVCFSSQRPHDNRPRGRTNLGTTKSQYGESRRRGRLEARHQSRRQANASPILLMEQAAQFC